MKTKKDIFNRVLDNVKLRKKANTYENKYHTANEELLTLYRNKNNTIEERDRYKELAVKQKEDIKKLKKEKLTLEDQLTVLKHQLEIQELKNEKLISKIKKYEKTTKKINKKRNRKEEK